MALKKAKLLIYSGKNKKKPKSMQVMFNPDKYTVGAQNEFEEAKTIGKETPNSQYKFGKGRSLSFELFYDTYESKKDVRKLTKKVYQAMKIDKDLHRPPKCSFVWGSFMFTGAMTDIKQTFTMFTDQGIPVRARLEVTIKEVKSVENQNRENSLQSADRTKERDLTEKEHLWMLADREYEDVSKWRAIAEANNIDNPRKLRNFSGLKIPPLE